MGKRSVAIMLTPRQRELLESLTRTKKASQQLVVRCQVVLLSAAGRHHEAQVDVLGIDRQRVRRWRHRWGVDGRRTERGARDVQGGAGSRHYRAGV